MPRNILVEFYDNEVNDFKWSKARRKDGKRKNNRHL